MKYNIHLYTLCYNEIDVLPFAVQYWSKLGVSKVVVYDNGSTDGSLEYMSLFPWIEVRHFETEGQNDIVHRYIKNECWKESKGKADFVIVCDMDEFIYSNDMDDVLDEMKKGGYNVLGTKWYMMCFDKRPMYDPDKFLHQQGDKFYPQVINHTKEWRHLGKFMLFDPNLVDSMNYSVGCHVSYPTPFIKLLETDKAYAIHVNKGFSEDYFVERRRIMGKNLSDVNRKWNMGIEYLRSEEDCRKEYRYYQANSINVPF